MRDLVTDEAAFTTITSAELSAAAKTKTRLASIDLLRGVAALAVVFHHAVLVVEPPVSRSANGVLYSVLRWGHLGVPLFFVISGFCIHLHWAKGFARDSAFRLSFARFWKRRIWRLYPTYFVVLCLSMFIIGVAVYRGVNVPLAKLYPEPVGRWFAADFVSHALMLHGFSPRFDGGGGNPVFWTLAREEYLYALYVPFLFVRRRIGLLRSLLAVTAFGLAFRLLLNAALAGTSHWRPIVDSSAIVLWVQWCLGAAAAEGFVGIVTIPRWLSHPLTVIVSAALARFAEAFAPALAPVLWGVSFFGLVVRAADAEKRGWELNSRWSRWLVFVGTISYSLYLIHYPARAVLKQFVIRWMPTQSWVGYWTLVGIVAVAGYVAARILFDLVERRFVSSPAELSGTAPSQPHAVSA